MEHWRFFVAILLLFILLRPVHEYFTENDMNIYDKRINISENKIDALNNVYDATRLLDISKNIMDLSSNITYLTELQIATQIATINTKIEKLGTVQTDASPAIDSNNAITLPRISSNNYVAYTFNLPVGTWLVTAHIVYISNQINSPTTVDPTIGVAFNPLPNTNSIPNINGITFPRTIGRWSRFSLSSTIKVTNTSTQQNISIYDGSGKVQVTVISTLIGI
jgi:hypothetical protein